MLEWTREEGKWQEAGGPWSGTAKEPQRGPGASLCTRSSLLPLAPQACCEQWSSKGGEPTVSDTGTTAHGPISLATTSAPPPQDKVAQDPALP